MSRLTVRAACAASLIIGLFFVFVWAPHPWGWVGFDNYYDLARSLASGKPFPTIDQPWGYAYFLALFYRLFGERLWIPLLAQVVLNASMPTLTFRAARQWFDERVALVAAVLVGLISFNTVYASTQSADAVCNVLFMAGVLVFVTAQRRDRWPSYAAAGTILTLTSQFRPNLLLVPLLLAAFTIATKNDISRALRHAGVLVAASMLVLAPWLARSYRLTGQMMPTSTHGGLQLWYGTLQTGPYLHSRAHNPRSTFETASFPYTSLDTVPLIVSGRLSPCSGEARPISVTYWTDRDATRRTIVAHSDQQNEFQGEIPVESAPATYFYDIAIGEQKPSPTLVFFVSTDHLGDMDTHGDLLDVFDVIRLMRHVAWREPVPDPDHLDFDGDGLLSAADAAAAAQTLAASADPRLRQGRRPDFAVDDSAAVLTFEDGSKISVAKDWNGRITDVAVSGGSADAALHASVPWSKLRAHANANGSECGALAAVGINTVFYREQPHMMRRYVALAIDNIRRDPGAYLASVLYRAARVFFIEGSDDPHTTHQFAGGGRVYQAAFFVSVVLLTLALIGLPLAWMRGAAFALPAVLIAYIPATLAFVLTNMRYSITVQPLLYMFVAVTIVTAMERTGVWRPRDREDEMAARYREGMQTAHRP